MHLKQSILCWNNSKRRLEGLIWHILNLRNLIVIVSVTFSQENKANVSLENIIDYLKKDMAATKPKEKVPIYTSLSLSICQISEKNELFVFDNINIKLEDINNDWFPVTRPFEIINEMIIFGTPPIVRIFEYTPDLFKILKGVRSNSFIDNEP